MGSAASMNTEFEHKEAVTPVVKAHVEACEGKIAKRDLAAKIAADENNPLDEEKALELLNPHYGDEDELEKEKFDNWFAPVVVENDTLEAAPEGEEKSSEEPAPAAEGEEKPAEEAAPAEGEEKPAEEAAPAAESEPAPAAEGEAAPAAEGEEKPAEEAAPAADKAEAAAEGEKPAEEAPEASA
mmetsp:Transcript_2074/g.2996  ORF Transcript_2074/g.2996 Transcript_2074/m.2996 type:complete len:184 (-) Transcript_2074:131-682(-)